MIKDIIACLNAQDWHIGDEDINIAKGKYSLPETWKEFKDNRKRWQKRSRTYTK